MDRAASYAQIVREVGELIERHVENDRERAAGLVFRAAALRLKQQLGADGAAAALIRIASELRGCP